MNAKSLLVVAAGLFAVALLLAPDLAAGFRSEDFLDFDRYTRVSLAATLSQPHLDYAQQHFWRPLADATTWLLVRGFGPHPLPIRVALVALHALAALGVACATRRLLGMSVGAALAAGLLAAAHPWSASVVSYLDGGTPTLLAAIGTFFGLAALGRWRDGERSLAPLAGWTLFAMLAYDAALILPVVLVVVAWLLPRSERRVPWLLLLLIPLILVVRQLVIGRAFDSYPLPAEGATRWAMACAFPARVLLCASRLLAPAFAELHPGAAAWRVGLAAVAAIAVVVAVAARRASAVAPLRQGLALVALVVGLLGFAPDLFLLEPGARPDELVLAYKSHPAALAAMLLAGWLLGRAAGRRWWGSLALAAPVIAVFVALRGPIVEAHEQAQHWATGIPASLIGHAEAGGARRFLVLDVPVKTQRGSRSVTRALQYGLACSVRPPFVPPERELFAYPLFRFAEDQQGDYVRSETVDALTRCSWIEPVRCVLGETEASVEPIARPPPSPASRYRLFARPDGVESALDAVENAPLVDVRADGSILLGVGGLGGSIDRLPGVPRLFALNRMHPCVAESLALASESERPRDAATDVVAFRARTGWFLEIARRFPDDVVFLVVEFLPDPARPTALEPPIAVSNVLPVRLRAAAVER